MLRLVWQLYLVSLRESLKPKKENMSKYGTLLLGMQFFLMSLTYDHIRDVYSWLIVLYLMIFFAQDIRYSKMMYIIPKKKEVMKRFFVCNSYLQFFVGSMIIALSIVFVENKMPEIITRRYWIGFWCILCVNSVMSIVSGIPQAFSKRRSRKVKCMRNFLVFFAGAVWVIWLLSCFDFVKVKMEIPMFIILFILLECFRWFCIKEIDLNDYQLPRFKEPVRKQRGNKEGGQVC